MLRMHRKMSQLILIDIQDKVIAPIGETSRLIENLVRLVRGARRLGVPLTVTEHYPQGLGQTVEVLGRELEIGTPILEKRHFSAIQDDQFRQHLEDIRDQGRGQAVVAGLETHVCVAQTALDLIVEGYQVFVVADAVASRTPESRSLALERLRQAGAAIVNSEMVLFEWLEMAGTPEFRDLLPLIK
jgi:nicotinamidase-related amidase